MHFLRSLVLSCVVFSAPAFAASDTDWPAITAQTKPWSRWWWLGNIGTKQDFTAEMQSYAAAGLGGLEITPIYGVRGEEQRFRDYLSPAWMEIFDHVLDEGQRLGLGLDMSTGTGWPFGGPWVTPDIAARAVVKRTFPLKGGEQLHEPVVATDTPLVRVAGPRKVTIGELKDPVAANSNLQDLALDQVRFPRRAILQALVAHSAAGESVTLTDRVDAAGRLDWTAPAGEWTLYAVFIGWHGKQVERAGPGGEGDALDHFSKEALARYLKQFDEAYAGHHANRLRAYFNDSYEVDDASGEANWTPRFFEEFQRRRGYDLRTELPAFFGQDTPEKNARVISDHRETISDLLLENFTQPWRAWAEGHGALIRNQAHGSPANLLDLYAASSIPETEGASIAGMKLASSAAHVTGKPLASAETATWLGEHWLSTLGDVKERVDLTLLGGVNHICYHGTVSSPPGEPWPGFHFYAAVELDPSNSLWTDFPVLNAYVARCQSLLQSGGPANDVLLYYPIFDAWAQRGNGAMPHFSSGGGPRGGGAPGQKAAQALLAAGYTFDYISDRLLQGVTFADGALHTGGAAYRVVLVSETKLMPLATLEKLVALAEAGATIVVQGALPADVPGLGELASRRAAYARLVARVSARGATDADRAERTVGRGSFVFGAALDGLLARAGVKRETLVERGLQFERRAFPDGHLYFLHNTSRAAVDGWVPLATAVSANVIFDPMSGRHGLGRTRQAADGAAEIYVQLAPGETCLVKTFAGGTHAAEPFAFWQPEGDALPVTGTWTVKFLSGGPTVPPAGEIAALRSWTELGGDAVKAFAGTAVYTLKFKTPFGGAEATLDLGEVADSARVTLNGRPIAALISAPWRVVVAHDAWAASGENVLEVTVTNLTANRIADLDRRDPSWKKFYNTNYPARLGTNRGPDGNFSAAKWTPRASGLLGPVTVTRVVRVP